MKKNQIKQNARWDTGLMERSVFAITSFTVQQHNDLLYIAVEIDRAQERGNQGLADVQAEKFFELFGAWRSKSALTHQIPEEKYANKHDTKTKENMKSYLTPERCEELGLEF